MIRSDTWVLSIITTGYVIESPPPLGLVKSTSSSSALLEEITSLFQKDAIEEVPSPDHSLGFYSHYFTVPKKGSGLRPILDLCSLNDFITTQHFCMTTLDSVIPLLKQYYWFVVIDLKDAYFHISIRHNHRKFLQFSIGGISYQFKFLPFSLSTAPRVFTKCLASVAAYPPPRRDSLPIFG